MHIETMRLKPQTTGCSFEIDVYRFGDRSGPHADVQAGLHADEVPALLLATRLIERLVGLEGQGAILGRVTVVPCANSIGLSQRVLGEPEGRFDLASGGNFNRGFPDVAAEVRHDLMSHASLSREDEVAAAIAASLDRHPASNIVEELQQLLLRLSADADTVLDLHSNHDAELFLYAPAPRADEGRLLAMALRAEIVILTSPRHSDATFEDASILPSLVSGSSRQGEAPRFVSTIELRGQRDVSRDLAAADAEAILRFLRHRGIVAAPDADRLSDAASPPLLVRDKDVVPVMAKRPGILLFETPLGAMVDKGDPVASLIDPGSGGREMLTAPVAGRVFSRTGTRYAVRGVEVVRIAAMERKPETT
jgi:predicted deacylase